MAYMLKPFFLLTPAQSYKPYSCVTASEAVPCIGRVMFITSSGTKTIGNRSLQPSDTNPILYCIL